MRKFKESNRKNTRILKGSLDATSEMANMVTDLL